MRDRARAVVIGGGVGGGLRPLLARAARVGGRRPRRARRPDERLDLPLGGARRPAARLAQPDADDDELGRPLPDPRGRGRARDRLARGRLPAARLVGGADGGARAPGGLGEDLRAAARAGLGRGGAEALSADVDRGRARRRLPADGRLHRPEPAHVRARRGRAQARRRDRNEHARDRRSASRTAASRASRPTRATIEADVVVNAGGMFAGEIGRLAGVNVPSSRWRTSTW